MRYSVDAETGERGYIITGDPIYLEPFNASRFQLEEHLKKVKQLTVDNPAQQKNLDNLEPRINTLVGHLENCIEVRKTKGFEAAEQLVATGLGKLTLDDIRNRVAAATHLEDSLMVVRMQTSAEESQSFNRVFISLLVIITIVLIVVYFIITTNIKALRRAELEAANKNWNLTGSGELTKNMQGNRQVIELAQIIINHLCGYLNAQIGAFYLMENDQGYLKLAAGFALDKNKMDNQLVQIGEGIVGQAAADNKTIWVENVPKNYFNVNTGFGTIVPQNIIAAPVVFENNVIGIIELGSLRGFTELQKTVFSNCA